MEKFEIKIDPRDFHPGLKDSMAEFESFIRMDKKRPFDELLKSLENRYCHCCFFGKVKGHLCGEPLCAECAKGLYGFDENEPKPSIKKIDPYYQLWYRKQKALPIFEAYIHAEMERFKLELKVAEMEEKNEKTPKAV